MKDLTIVPVYNEWPHLLGVLRELRQHRASILVVDDGSEDKSFLGVLKSEGFPFISLSFNLGHWPAVQAGFRYALARGYQAAVTFDGDGQHLPAEISRILPLLAEGCDVVIGGNRSRGGLARQLCRGILKRLSGLEVIDFTSGFRAYSRRAMETMSGPDFANLEYQDLGVLFLAARSGLRLTEVPVAMRARVGETSRVFPDLFSVLRYLFITLTFILARRP